MIVPQTGSSVQPSRGRGGEECATDQGAGQVEEPLEEVGPALVANPEAAAGPRNRRPCQRGAWPGACAAAPVSPAGRRSKGSRRPAEGGASSRGRWRPRGTRPMGYRSGRRRGGTWSRAYRGQPVRPGLLTPLFARTLKLSTLARDQAMLAASPSQFRSVSCRRCQTPASCQSRRRRQQVEPLPQPSSLGNNRQGQPVRRTKTMPSRAARSGIRGRPPLSFAGSSGSKGSIASHRSVGTSIDAFMTHDHATARRVLKQGLRACCKTTFQVC
jgi:hypothetical protein